MPPPIEKQSHVRKDSPMTTYQASASSQTPLGHPQHPKRPSSQPLDEETIAQFKELVRKFSELDTIEDILGFNNYLIKELKDQQLVSQYREWSKKSLKPNCDMGLGIREHFKCDLRDADWNASNKHVEWVFSRMVYGGWEFRGNLYPVGHLQDFWLILELNMWAIFPQNADPRQRKSHHVPDLLMDRVLGLRYKPVEDGSTSKSFLFFSLGYVRYTGAFKISQDQPIAELVGESEIEWTDTPYILAIGVRADGRTQVQDDQEKYYLISRQGHPGLPRASPEDSDDDSLDFVLSRNPPQYTVFGVKEHSPGFLIEDISSVHAGQEIVLEPLSCSTAEVVETVIEQENGKYTRVGLFK